MLKPTFLICILILFGSLEVKPAETHGNFHTIGVVLDAPKGVAPAGIREVRLFQVHNGKLRRLLDPVQVYNYSYYAGSVFGLQPGTKYRFHAEFVDASGKVFHREEFNGRTRPEPGEPPKARMEIHVATNGNDANPGTVTKPKRTLAGALKNANRAGTHVILHGGVYFEGDLPAVGKGTAEAPIVIRGAKGEIVILDGSDEACLSVRWNNLGSGYYSAPFAGSTKVVCMKNRKTGEVRRLYPVGSLANLKAKRIGRSTFGTYKITEAYFCTGKELIIYCPYYKAGETLIHASRRGSVAEHSGSRHIVYSDLTCQFFHGQVFYVNDSSDLIFRRCTFQYCSLPIAVKRSSHRLLVEHCRFVDDCTRWGFLPKGFDDVGYSDYIELGAVYVHTPYEGRGLVFRHNVIDGLFDGVHLTPMGPPSKVRTHETDFYNNRILKVCDDLIEADGQCCNLRIFRNRMENFLSGISIAQGYQGPTYVLYNVMSGMGNSSAVKLPPHFEGYPVKTNGGTRYGITGWAFFFHNTCHTTVPKTNAFRVQVAKWRKLVFANNIWQGTRNGFVFWRDVVSPISMANDIIHAETGALLKVRSKTYSEQVQARQRLSFLSGALVVDPKLRDPQRGDFRLQLGSPAIDGGVLIPGVNDKNFQGSAPDIGALKFGK